MLIINARYLLFCHNPLILRESHCAFAVRLVRFAADLLDEAFIVVVVVGPYSYINNNCMFLKKAPTSCTEENV